MLLFMQTHLIIFYFKIKQNTAEMGLSEKNKNHRGHRETQRFLCWKLSLQVLEAFAASAGSFRCKCWKLSLQVLEAFAASTKIFSISLWLNSYLLGSSIEPAFYLIILNQALRVKQL